MPRFAANLSLMYGEWPFPARFAAAAEDGFEGVECQFPYAFAANELAARRGDAGVELVLLNAPAGDPARGERGLAALPGREADFRRGFLDQALAYADALACRRVHVMAGVAEAGADPGAMRDCFLANLAWAAAQAAPHGVQVLIEPLNRRDVPGYLFCRQDEAHALVAEAGAANLAVQFDLYHCQIVEGDLTRRLTRHLDPGAPTPVGHLQVAGVPDRHEPDHGELDSAWLFGLVDALGFSGWIGAEYRPRHATRAGLGWFQPWRLRGGAGGRS